MPGSPMLTEERFLARQDAPADPNFSVSSLGQAGQDAALQTSTPSGPVVTSGRTMTIGGSVAAAALMLVVVVLAGGWGWGKVSEVPTQLADGTVAMRPALESPLMLWGAVGLGFVLAIVTAFAPKLARITGLLYAAAQGVALGIISHLYEVQYTGIVVQAVLATVGTTLVMLALYSLRILRATPRFTKMVIGATFGIMIMYVIGFVASFFTDGLMFWNQPSPLGIIISVFIAGVAAFNLILDFDMIERGSKAGMPSYYEWYAAFGLLVTLVWLYLEMLRLIAKVRSN